MLQVSRLADYATIVMVYIARQGSIHNARDIAEHTFIALPTVSKILKLMAKGNLLISQRGVKGGYSLAKKPEEISIAEVLIAIEGEFGMTDCSHASGSCTLEPLCQVRSNWRILSQAIFKTLTCVKLSDMAKPITEPKIFLDKSNFWPQSLNGR